MKKKKVEGLSFADWKLTKVAKRLFMDFEATPEEIAEQVLKPTQYSPIVKERLAARIVNEIRKDPVLQKYLV